MASVSSLGIGSNLDLSGLLDKLSVSENAPLASIAARQASFTTKLSAYGVLQGSLSNLQAAALKLSDASLFQGIATQSSDTGVLSASAGASGVPGTYAINVTQMAKAQSLAAAGVADATAAVGKGTVTIDFGTITDSATPSYNASTGKYSSATFAASATPAPQSITIDDSNNSLEGLRDAINKNTAMGVTASIVNDGSNTPYRLVLNSNTTGQAMSMRIAVTGDASLQSLISHDASSTQNMQQTTAASSSNLTVNGIAVTSATNTVVDAVQGVTMTLAGTGSSSLVVSRDLATASTAANDFVNAYNKLQDTAKQLTSYNTTTKVGAALLGDATLRGVLERVRSALNTPQEGSLKVLSNVGISLQASGSMTMDKDKFSAAFSASSSDVAELFAGTGVASTNGYGTQFNTLLKGFTSSTGTLSNATAGINLTLKTLAQTYTDKQTIANAAIERYRAQFTQLDMLISKMTSTSNYLTQQFSAMSSAK
jgi:flagellar hook-associated protein 2